MTLNQYAIEIGLKEVKHNSIIGMAIDQYNEDPTKERLLRLIPQLKSQAQDNISLMASVLGDELTIIILST